MNYNSSAYAAEQTNKRTKKQHNNFFNNDIFHLLSFKISLFELGFILHQPTSLHSQKTLGLGWAIGIYPSGFK